MRLTRCLGAAPTRRSTFPPARFLVQLHGVKMPLPLPDDLVHASRLLAHIPSPSAVVLHRSWASKMSKQTIARPPECYLRVVFLTSDFRTASPPCRHSAQPSPSCALRDTDFVRRCSSCVTSRPRAGARRIRSGALPVGSRVELDAAPTRSPRAGTRAHTHIPSAAPRTGSCPARAAFAQGAPPHALRRKTRGLCRWKRRQRGLGELGMSEHGGRGDYIALRPTSGSSPPRVRTTTTIADADKVVVGHASSPHL
ncbi:hypothetical protein DFH09DRAFT_613574 [Mycena vulgaris]|nr:hypothetical protein DFH09DRAFT_613574 [Mycena vulgaris]